MQVLMIFLFFSAPDVRCVKSKIGKSYTLNMHTYVSSRVRAAFIYFHFEFFKLQRSRSKSLIDLNGRQYSVNSKFGNTFYLNFEPERSNQQNFYAFYD